MPKSIELGTNTEVELVTAYAVSNQQFACAASAPAWMVIGSFYMPSPATVILEAIGLVTVTSAVLNLRLFDLDDAAIVDGSLTDTITASVDQRVVSGAFDILGGHLYQIQAQGTGTGNALVRAAQLLNA